MSFIARCLVLADPALPGVIEGAKDIPTFADSFEKADNWPGAAFNNPGEVTFTASVFTDSYEAADGWPGAT